MQLNHNVRARYMPRRPVQNRVSEAERQFMNGIRDVKDSPFAISNGMSAFDLPMTAGNVLVQGPPPGPEPQHITRSVHEPNQVVEKFQATLSTDNKARKDAAMTAKQVFQLESACLADLSSKEKPSSPQSQTRYTPLRSSIPTSQPGFTSFLSDMYSYPAAPTSTLQPANASMFSATSLPRSSPVSSMQPGIAASITSGLLTPGTKRVASPKEGHGKTKRRLVRASGVPLRPPLSPISASTTQLPDNSAQSFCLSPISPSPGHAVQQDCIHPLISDQQPSMGAAPSSVQTHSLIEGSMGSTLSDLDNDDEWLRGLAEFDEILNVETQQVFNVGVQISMSQVRDELMGDTERPVVCRAEDLDLDSGLEQYEEQLRIAESRFQDQDINPDLYARNYHSNKSAKGAERSFDLWLMRRFPPPPPTAPAAIKRAWKPVTLVSLYLDTKDAGTNALHPSILRLDDLISQWLLAVKGLKRTSFLLLLPSLTRSMKYHMEDNRIKHGILLPQLSLKKHDGFLKTRRNADAVAKKLTKEGKGTVTHKKALPPADFAKLLDWRRAHPPETMTAPQMQAWESVLLGYHACLRGGREHYEFTMAMTRCELTADGEERLFVDKSLNGTKTSTGGLDSKEPQPPFYVYKCEIMPEMCLVEWYKFKVSLREKQGIKGDQWYCEMNWNRAATKKMRSTYDDAKARGEVNPIKSAEYKGDANFNNTAYYPATNAQAFNDRPLGHNKIEDLICYICQEAGIITDYKDREQRTGHTNHCMRATATSYALNQGIPKEDVMRLTGHRNVDSLKHYFEHDETYDRAINVARIASMAGIAVNRPAVHAQLLAQKNAGGASLAAGRAPTRPSTVAADEPINIDLKETPESTSEAQGTWHHGGSDSAAPATSLVQPGNLSNPLPLTSPIRSTLPESNDNGVSDEDMWAIDLDNPRALKLKSQPPPQNIPALHHADSTKQFSKSCASASSEAFQPHPANGYNGHSHQPAPFCFPSSYQCNPQQHLQPQHLGCQPQHAYHPPPVAYPPQHPYHPHQFGPLQTYNGIAAGMEALGMGMIRGMAMASMPVYQQQFHQQQCHLPSPYYMTQPAHHQTVQVAICNNQAASYASHPPVRPMGHPPIQHVMANYMPPSTASCPTYIRNLQESSWISSTTPGQG